MSSPNSFYPPLPDDYYDDEVACETCNDDGVFHEERIMPNGEPGEVITGRCPDCNPAAGLSGSKGEG